MLISHMHPDPIDGMYRSDGTKTYPNDTYYVGAKKLTFSSQEPLDLSQPPSACSTSSSSTRSSRSRRRTSTIPWTWYSDWAIKTRHELVALPLEPSWQSFTPHFPWPSRGRVHNENGKATWAPASQG
jgi:hypothetical protein